jgi:hypothetical protein
MSGTKVSCPQPLSLLAACLIQPVPPGTVGYAVSANGKVLKAGTLNVPAHSLTIRVTPWEGSKPQLATLGVEIVSLVGLLVFGGDALIVGAQQHPVPTWATIGGLSSIGIGLITVVVENALKRGYPLVQEESSF